MIQVYEFLLNNKKKTLTQKVTVINYLNGCLLVNRIVALYHSTPALHAGKKIWMWAWGARSI